MKILLINTTDGKGGAAQLTYSLKKGLEKHGQTTSMFVKQKYTADKNIFIISRPHKILTIIEKILKKITGKDLITSIKSKCRVAVASDINFFNNKNLLNSEEFKKADIIHCHNLHGNYFNLKLLQKISKIKPVVWTLHDMWALTPHQAWLIKDSQDIEKFKMEIKPHLKWDNQNFLFKSKQKIYVDSKLNIVGTCDWFISEIKNSILKKQKTYLIHNGIDEKIFEPRDKKTARKKLGLPQDKTIITFMANGGKDNEQKGWGYAQEVIEHYSNDTKILFLCIGKQEENNKNKNIHYIKYIDEESIFSLYYSASDIFLNPSLAEAFGLIVVQAMACGAPIVTFPVGIVKEAIQHKQNGYIANYQDARDLIKGIDYILNLPKKDIKIMGKLSRQKVIKNFTLDIMTKNYIKLYKQILQQ